MLTGELSPTDIVRLDGRPSSGVVAAIQLCCSKVCNVDIV